METLVKNLLINYFKENKNILTVPYKEIKKHIQQNNLRMLLKEYAVHIHELSFYYSELKTII